MKAKKKADPILADGGRPLRCLRMAESYRNTWLAFKCSGDASELFEHNLPTPHYFQRENAALYALGWLINGFFHTGKGVEYLNDIIARIILSMPVLEKIDIEPATRSTPIKLQQLQNAVSLPAKIRTRIDTANRYQDTVFWAIKLQAERYIRVLGGWFPYEELERWAFSVFKAPGDVKDRSTLRAKCRSIWHWYEKRNFTIPEGRKFTMSREDNIKRVNEQRKLDAKRKVLEASNGLTVRKKNGKISIKAVSEHTGISAKTVSKYLKELELI